MPVKVIWAVPQRVILSRGYGSVTRQENDEADTQVLSLLESGKRPVHVILDLSQVTDFPTYQLEERLAIFRAVANHPNAGWGVLAGTTNPVIRMATKVLLRLYGVRFKLFATSQAALAFLNEADETLP
jgi:hypothetical protein